MSPRLLAPAGLWAALLFLGTLLVVGELRPGYDHMLQGVSELGARGAPHAWAMNLLGFLLPGILIGFFGVGLHHGLGELPGSRLGPLLLSISGLGWAAAGLFPLDLRGNGVQLHGIAALVCFVGAAVGMQLLARRVRGQAGLFGVITRLCALLMLGNLFVQERPLLERVFLAVYFLWLAGSSLWLGRRLDVAARKPSREP